MRVPSLAWKEYAGDFNSMTDEEIQKEVDAARDRIDEDESWLEAVASWEQAGKPRKAKNDHPPLS